MTVAGPVRTGSGLPGAPAAIPVVAVVGVAHTGMPLALRERLHVPPQRALELDRSLAGDLGEAIVVATCNRTELYLTAARTAVATRRAAAALPDLRSAGSALYSFSNERAARHLFRVAAGLESVVPGDTHVAAQLRQAHQFARSVGACGPLLGRLFESASATSKRIRSETEVSSGSTSIPAAAMAMAAKHVGPLAECRVLVVGTGHVARLAALNAASRGCRRLVVAGRHIERARALADQVAGRAVPLADLHAEMVEADVVVAATAAPSFVLTIEHAASTSASRDDHALLILDLAAPRDVDPIFRELPRTLLIDLDDLGSMITRNGAQRRAQFAQADAIAREEAGRYEAWRRARALVPAITEIHRYGQRARESVFAKHEAALAKLGPNERSLIETITAQLVAKLLHEPMVELRQRPLNGQ